MRDQSALGAAALGQLAITSLVLWVAGATVEADLYNAAVAIPWFFLLVAAGPHIAHAIRGVIHLAGGDPWEARRAFTSAVRTVLVGHAAMTSIGFGLSTWLPGAVFPDLAPAERLSSLFRISLFGYFLLGATLVLAHAGRRGDGGMLAWSGPLGQVAGVAIVAVAFGEDVRIEDLAWGALAGAAIGFAFVSWRVSRFGLGFDWSTPWAHRSLRAFTARAAPNAIVATLLGVEATLPALGGQFAGEGAISALTGVRWVVVGAAWVAVGSDPDGNDPTRAVSSEAFLRAGLALGLLVGLANPLLGTIFGWGEMEPAAVETASLLLVVAAMGTPFAMVTRSLGAMGASRSSVVWSAAAVLATLPLTVGAGKALGSGAVAAMWTLHVAALSSISWLTRRAEDRVGPDAGVLTRAGLGAVAAMAAALAASWVGDRVSVPAPIALLVGAAGAVIVWARTIEHLGTDSRSVLRGGPGTTGTR